MSIVNLLFLLAWIALAIPKRTRPITLAVVTLWLIKEASVALWIDNDRTKVIGSTFIAISLCANMIWYRKKYINQIKGTRAKER